MVDLLATQVQTPTINGVQSFVQGAQAKQTLDAAQLQNANAAISLIGQVALGAQGGDINAPADPTKWAQGQALLKAHGLDVSSIPPTAAPMVARASISTLGQIQTAQNQRDFELRMAEFANTLKQQAFSNTMDVNKTNFEQHNQLQPQSYYGVTTPDIARANAGLPPLPTIGPNGQPVQTQSAQAQTPSGSQPPMGASPMGQQQMQAVPGVNAPQAPKTIGGLPVGSPAAIQSKAIGDGIIDGTMPPDSLGKFSHYTAPVMAYLKDNGYDLSKAQMQILAEKKHVASLNGTQQTRIRQNLDTLQHSLERVQELADEWKGTGVPAFNAATINLAMQGGLGEKAQSLATLLHAQVNDIDAEIAGVYMGGNSPTDHALEVASSNLRADWSQQTFDDAVNQIRINAGFRRQALENVGAAGVGNDNPYSYGTPAAKAGEATTSTFVYNPDTGDLE